MQPFPKFLPNGTFSTLLRTRSTQPSEAFRERTMCAAITLVLLFFSLMALIDFSQVRHDREPLTFIWYGVIYFLSASVLIGLHYSRVRLAAWFMVLSLVLLVLDPSRAYWSPGTIVFSLMFTFLFEMILDNWMEVAIAVTANLGLYAWIAATSGPAPFTGLDYFSQPGTALLTVFCAHLIIMGVAYFIRCAQQEQDRAEVLLTQHKADVLRQFLNHTSHDLRTALTKMHLQMYVLRHRQPSAGQVEMDALENSVEQLQKMLLAMLEMSHLDDLTEFAAVQVDVHELIACLLEQHGPAIAAKRLKVMFAPSMPALFIDADKDYLARAIGNVLENAINFSPESGIVAITTACTAGKVLIAVHDSGPGIDPVQLRHIFDRFYRGTEARTQSNGLNGLGLSITKKIVDLHRGEVNVESVLNMGTTVTLKLPTKQRVPAPIPKFLSLP